MSASERNITNYMLRIYTILDKLTDEELASIVNGTGTLQFKDTRPKEKPPVPLELEQHCEHIMSLNTREDANVYIASLKLNKEKLVLMAGILKVNINKSDKKDVIVNKIIESVVGFKLRTEAIMNMDLKH